jgi:protein-tyrosine-phosphatase
MNAEANDLAQRARAFAALGEPARLRLVEELAGGDAMPSELAARLGFPSNLLAHHLKVLEDAGLIRRARSEGDRRRTYVQLVMATAPTIRPRSPVAAGRVVFVCTANSARSQLAAALWTTVSDVPVASGGTHPARRVATGAVKAARRRGLPLSARATPRMFDGAHGGDLVVTVCDRAREDLELTGAIHWSLRDPVRIGTTAAFDATVDELQHRVHGLAERLADVS